MRKKCERAARALEQILRVISHDVHAGTTPLELACKAERMIQRAGGRSPFPKYHFPYALSVGRGNVVAHGVPSDQPFRPGEIVRLDCAIELDGACADLAVTVIVPGGSSKEEMAYHDIDLVARRAAHAAAAMARPGVTVSSLWDEMERVVHGYDYGIIVNLAGHGIGKEMHELPTIVPGESYRLRAGQILCIEPFVVLCDPFQGRVNAYEERHGLVVPDLVVGAHHEIMVAVEDECGVIVGEI